MPNRLKFNPKGHHYTLEINGVDKPITGVTTILGVIAKPALIGWAANQAVDYIKQNSELTDDGYIVPEIVAEDARKAHTKKRDKAGDIGTQAHQIIENYIKTGEIEEPSDEQVKKMVNNFIAWATKNKVKFLASEKQVFSEEFYFCGTYDFLCEMDGKIFLGDVKTSSNVYPEHFIQCAAYQICEEEQNPDLKINGHIIVNLTKDGKINTKQSFDFVGYKRTFLSALIIYRQLNDQKQ